MTSHQINISSSWKSILSDQFDQSYFQELIHFVKSEYISQDIYPKGAHIFRAFDSVQFEKVKVVILGQDPYHGPGQANGLCFSVDNGIPLPPSLRNIFKELCQDLKMDQTPSSDLGTWAEQGVLLLNSTLTVRKNLAGSHQGKGWEIFTNSVIQKLNAHRENIVYMLWGSYAQKKANFLNEKRNLVLKSVHPSPLSAHRGFFGNGHFSRANEYLSKTGQRPIVW